VAITLDRYAGLFIDHLEGVDDRMDVVLADGEWYESDTENTIAPIKRIAL